MSKTTKSKVTTTASDLQTVKNTATGDDAPKTTAAESNPNPTTDCADLNTVKSTVQTETKESKQQDVEGKI
ncbi:hypothetical protein AAVH_14501 [Aphelenchoides avenae]|nr:hypothetical protein AAVH_14501 [Aphelenchus avenae]